MIYILECFIIISDILIYYYKINNSLDILNDFKNIINL